MCGIKKVIYLCKTSAKSDIIVLMSTFILTVVFDLVVAIEVDDAAPEITFALSSASSICMQKFSAPTLS